MADHLHFELVSPERLVMDTDAARVLVPGSEGDFEVLPNHAPVMSTIRPGVLRVQKAEGGEFFEIFIRGGFAEVGSDGLLVLAEEAVPVAELDSAEIELRLNDAKEDLEDARDDEEHRLAAETIRRLGELKKAIG